MLTGLMSQTSIERLTEYLVQLPPQSQALLMREFERALERGEDTTVATFVLEQLRKIVRGAEGLGVGDRVQVELVRTDFEHGYVDFART